MEESSLFNEVLHLHPAVVPRIVSENGINGRLAFRVVVTLTSDHEQEVADHRYTVLIPVWKSQATVRQTGGVHAVFSKQFV